jgi:CheY-like chemotaxis protein
MSAASSSEPGVGLLLSDDLLFRSRITGTAEALGLKIKAVRSPQDLLREAPTLGSACILIDLHNPGLVIGDVVRGLRALDPVPRIIGYGSHVDTATLRQAREAGCDRVLPRSQFVEELPRALAEWLTPPATG